MKTLVLIRHAKSSWKDASLGDHQRPLNRRGERNRWQMADHLNRLPLRVEQVYSSSATRARLTAEALAPALSDQPPHYEDELYCFDAASLIHWLRRRSGQVNAIALVGHNPALTELANWLDPEPLENLPTCAVLLLHLPITAWAELDRGRAQRRQLWLAREL
ncbi:SixA phosphatase family protein [Motiliproteus sediminis]|uniref:SixA phosphatase family protein n=1 Tax=Motiliproteus sediminis TaxID=1468178 RepID=UPI001AEF6037|nr:histidine phosphatase family protein [Motiliproteus sediminis]